MKEVKAGLLWGGKLRERPFPRCDERILEAL